MRSKKYLESRCKIITKANSLIQKARFDLSLQQQKVILYLISQINPYDEQFKLYTFDIQNFCRVIGADDTSGGNYSYLKNQIKEISDKSIWVRLEDGRETLVRWIQKPYIDEKSGTIQIRLDEDMKPFLLQLKRNYTTYELAYTLLFNSKYSLRLYEVVKSFHYHELEEYKHKFTVDELKVMMGAEVYTQYKGFKQNALKKAVEEINKYSDKEISYNEIKEGRKVKEIEFIIKSKDSSDIIQLRTAIDLELGPEQLTFWDI